MDCKQCKFQHFCCLSQEKEMEKQKILYQQARLHARGAAEMVLQMISASKGRLGPMVTGTLKLGISILNGGNVLVQQVKLCKTDWENVSFVSQRILSSENALMLYNSLENAGLFEGKTRCGLL